MTSADVMAVYTACGPCRNQEHLTPHPVVAQMAAITIRQGDPAVGRRRSACARAQGVGQLDCLDQLALELTTDHRVPARLGPLGEVAHT
jgi:hypothetical protein